jgi:hypothetical protein
MFLTMKKYMGVYVQIHVFLTSALVGGEWSASRSGRFAPGKSPLYPLDRRLGGSTNRFGWRGEERKIAAARTRTPTLDRLARSQSLDDCAIPAPTSLRYVWHVAFTLGLRESRKNTARLSDLRASNRKRQCVLRKRIPAPQSSHPMQHCSEGANVRSSSIKWV